MDPTNDDDPPDVAALRVRLNLLRQEHADLDASVAALEGKAMPDQIQIARLKKKKLWLKDEIVQVEDDLITDIIA